MASSASGIVTVAAGPFPGQQPGTSGLRKPTKEFETPGYLECFIQAYFSAQDPESLRGSTLIVAGDGRYFSDRAFAVIARMAAAQGVGRVVTGRRFLMSTPALSAEIAHRKAFGGIVLTASHNPGGPNADFGVKFNGANGGPAPTSVTERVFELSLETREYQIVEQDDILEWDFSAPATFQLAGMEIEVVDETQVWLELMKTQFDFDSIRALVHRADFKVLVDAMHGVAGPYARRLLVDELGLTPECLQNADPLPDFGGGHPDPNLVYAKELVACMGIPQPGEPASTLEDSAIPDLGAACDGDADRNMILGKRFFVTPSDSLALLAHYARDAIPVFTHHGLPGVARSMPTSAAVDRVGDALGIPVFVTPTGWKYFGNLLDAGKIAMCGEESFGTGSAHIREKDGLWAVLAWLSVLASRNTDASEPLVSVQSIVHEHWERYGRNYYSRYDYEQVDKARAEAMMQRMAAMQDATLAKHEFGSYVLTGVEEFEYTDPVDESVAKHQGIQVFFSDGSRVVFRLSGTGSVGATVRMYLEAFVPSTGDLLADTQDSLQELVAAALEISDIVEFTGRQSPTVIT